jgi:hypothetical protein
VQEDNIGNIGGFGDVALSHKLMLDAQPQLKDKLAPDAPQAFAAAIAQRLRSVGTSGGEPLLWLPEIAKSPESLREAELLRAAGVTVLEEGGREKLEVRPDGLYVTTPGWFGPRRRRVSVLLSPLNVVALDVLDPNIIAQKSLLQDGLGWLITRSFTSSRVRRQAEELLGELNARPERLASIVERFLKLPGIEAYLKKSELHPLPGLNRLVSEGKVILGLPHWAEFASDKAIYPYVDKVIREILKEEPLLHTTPSMRLSEWPAGTLPPRKDYVLKPTSEAGGRGVVVGSNVSDATWEKAVADARPAAGDFVLQRYVAYSTLEGRPIDRRVLVMVDPGSITVSPQMFGRIAGPSGKTNISADAEGIVHLNLRDCGDAWARLH